MISPGLSTKFTMLAKLSGPSHQGQRSRSAQTAPETHAARHQLLAQPHLEHQLRAKQLGRSDLEIAPGKALQLEIRPPGVAPTAPGSRARTWHLALEKNREVDLGQR